MKILPNIIYIFLFVFFDVESNVVLSTREEDGLGDIQNRLKMELIKLLQKSEEK